MNARRRLSIASAAALAASLLAGCASDVVVPSSSGSSSATTSAATGPGAAAGAGGTMGSVGSTGTGGAGGTPSSTSGAGGMTGTGGAGGASSAGGAGPGPGDVLDPSAVYLLGTLEEGACYRDALATWSNPSAATVGFDCYFDSAHAIVRPTDGRIIYTNTFEDQIREFHCDECTYTGVYPMTLLANDTILPSPPCGPGGFYSLAFQVAPNGSILHTCTTDPLVWYDDNGAPAYNGAGDKLLHLGFGSQALTMSRIVDLATMTSVDITGLPGVPILTERAVPPDAFWVVLDTGGPGKIDAQELWKIDAMGVAVKVGAYPPAPAGYTVEPASSRLDASGALFQFGHVNNAVTDVIFRRQVGGMTDIVYTEAQNPLVKIHISALLTGP